AQHVLDVRRRAGQAMKIVDRDAASSAVGAENLDLRVERRQRNGHVGRKGRDAVLARAEDRVDAVDAADRGTTGPRLALVAGRRDVVEVRTAGTLQEVAAHRRLVAQLSGRAG